MSSLVVFNDIYKSDAFKKGVSVINKQLKKHELRVDIKFLKDKEDEHGLKGKFAWAVSVFPAFYERRLNNEPSS
tara:strand:+ start:387 stop:608 length:222 start_codon:yes stop_codon:yes gene_type:complete